MNSVLLTDIATALAEHETEILADWLEAQSAASTLRPDLLSLDALREESHQFLRLLRDTLSGLTALDDIRRPEWDAMRDFLTTLSRSRAQQGFLPSETATLLFSLKQPLVMRLRAAYRDDPERPADALWAVATLLDQLGLYTTDVFRQDALQEREDMLAVVSHDLRNPLAVINITADLLRKNGARQEDGHLLAHAEKIR